MCVCVRACMCVCVCVCVYDVGVMRLSETRFAKTRHNSEKTEIQFLCMTRKPHSSTICVYPDRATDSQVCFYCMTSYL